MRVLVHDFGGYAFPAQLSRELARRGHSVTHAYCATVVSGKGRLDRAPDDPERLRLRALSLRRYDKHSLRRRLPQEAAYGRILAAEIDADRPDVVLSANTPLVAQAIAQPRCARRGVAFVFWQQDVLSRAIARLAADRLSGAVADLVARSFRRIEARIARHSDFVVAISPAYVPILSAWNVGSDRVEVIENWAPLEELPVLPQENAWSRKHGLAGRPVVLYSGTLGLKHGSQRLLELASRLTGQAMVVVVSEGAAADALRRRALANGDENLVVLPFQPHRRVAELLASARVLLVLLDERAGDFSVPSKTLTYLCAGRPIVAAVPASNLAARTMRDAEAGIVVDPDDLDGLVTAVSRLLSDEEAGRRFGRSARAYAERSFDIGVIADRFENVLARAVERRAAGGDSRKSALARIAPEPE